MRRLGVCERKGSGVDKVVSAAELYQLPAPDFRVGEIRTTSVLFAHRDFAEMTKSDRIRACFQHCVLQYISGKRMSNQSLRERFGLPGTKANRRSANRRSHPNAQQKEPPKLSSLAGKTTRLDIDAIVAEMLALTRDATGQPSFPSEIGSLAQLATQKLLRRQGNESELAKPWTCRADSLAHTATAGRCGSPLAQDSPEFPPLV